MRIVESYVGPSASLPEHEKQAMPRPPASLVAVKLKATLDGLDAPVAYVSLSESGATRVAEAARSLLPDVDVIVLPPWDCLPYDRIPPSRQCMGRRMDALRVWSEDGSKRKLLITSLDAMLQRVPPLKVIDRSWIELVAGKTFDHAGFRHFMESTGYIEDGLVDDPGEYAFRDDVIDIFPAGLPGPVRVVLTEDGTIGELKAYDPATQRTQYTLDSIVLGPASEAVSPKRETTEPLPDVTERALFELYGDMSTVFDRLEDASIVFAAGTAERLESYLDIIDDARQSHRDIRRQDIESRCSLYLDRATWDERVGNFPVVDLDFDDASALPVFLDESNPRRAFAAFVKQEIQAGRTVVLGGRGKVFDGLCRRIERDGGTRLVAVDGWSDVLTAERGSLLKLDCTLERGFKDGGLDIVVVTAADVLGDAMEASDAAVLLGEPELTLGDVVVHEDHGVGILRNLESVTVEGMQRDAARLEYRGGDSVLVAMEEFGRLWRYGSEPEAVSLDRLHTDAWTKKRASIDKDVRATARHLMRLAEERKAVETEAIVPPRPQYAKFTARFPYLVTTDQGVAADAILSDLASGKVMNRLVCGDVGFGKTEVALRAAAAVALAGRQVVVIAPTTVLTRQHFNTFQRRFEGTGVTVAMLSRVATATEAKQVKAGLASGEIGVVVATHAILAKDVSFARLGLLIVDEEHRFGTRDKQAMRALAPLLHMLPMSATPIPRTLQTAMIGVQDVSLLRTAPLKRRPVRTSLSVFDKASMRTALLREKRRGGQSFVVSPQIEDLEQLQTMLGELVPELSVCLAHGKMRAADMDEIMVKFADGEGDVLLSTNIIESGLDVPMANTIFIWRADRFGLAQLHQLRGRVGRGRTQGIAYLLTAEGDDIAEDTRLRLMTMVENDRLGAGLAISMRDLDQRGGGDLTGEDQAGHMKLIGVGLYQKLLERAVTGAAKAGTSSPNDIAVNLGVSGTIPEDYVPDAAVRLNLYAKLMRAASTAQIDEFSEELEDRFGDVPEEVSMLLRLAKLKIAAAALGISKLDAGPRAMAITFASKPAQKAVKALSGKHPATLREDRVIYEIPLDTAVERIVFFENLFQAR